MPSEEVRRLLKLFGVTSGALMSYGADDIESYNAPP